MSPQSLTPTRRRFALFALALGGFGIGSSEFVSMGLLPGIASTLLPDLMEADPERGIARAGWAISAYALGVVVGAPTVALLGVRMRRGRLAVLLAACLLLGTALSALMPTFELTVFARFLAGLPHGAYFGVASLIAASLMGPGSQGKGVAVALSGLTVATLVGVPLLTAFGQLLSWRTSYLLIAGIFALTVTLLILALPHEERPAPRSVRAELAMFRRTQIWALILIAAIGFSGFFAVYSYIAEITTRVTGMPEGFVPLVLAAAGLGMTLGNITGGILTDRSLERTVLIAFPALIVSLIALLVIVAHPIGLMVGIFLMTFTSSMLGPSMQTWLIIVAGPSAVLGAATNHAAFNIGNAIGAAVGGSVIAAGYGYTAPIVAALIIAIIGLAMVVATLWMRDLMARRRARLRAACPA